MTSAPRARLSTWIWLAPVAFLVHDAEEVVTMAPWLRVHASELPQPVRPLAAAVTTQGMAWSVALLLAALLLVTWRGARSAAAGRRSWPFLVAAGALAGNALTHVGQAAYFRGYAPGVLTAVLVSGPYCVLLAGALRRAGLATGREVTVLLVLGIVVQLPIALAALAVGAGLAGAMR